MEKRRIKSILGNLLFRSGLYKRFFRGRAVIAVFHRVDDRYSSDAITCGRRLFTEHLEFFKRYFRVVSFSTLMDKLRRGEDLSCHLAITFDDGYRDNLTVAAAELRRVGLPACFFIATDFIGTRRIPWWDEAGGIRSEWMTWDDVRQLRNLGFELGAHTCNHVDLGVVEGSEADEEIRRSGRKLEAETGQPVAWFSYPYGRAHQLSEANRVRVRGAGYACCASAYGGVVLDRSDPFRICRTPVSQWHLSPAQFGFEVMLDQRH